MAAAVLAVDVEIDQKLQDVCQIRTGALLSDDTNLKLELLANLLYLYDNSWSLEQEGVRIVVGHAYHVVQQQAEDLKRPAVLKKMRKWLTLSELGHLLGEGSQLVDPRKFGRLVTGLMDRLEHKMGLEGLRTRVRIVASQVAKTAKGKENIKSPVAGARTEKVDVLPPPVGNEIPRTPNIPRGNQIPRTPPLSGEESNASLSNVSAESVTMDIKKMRNPQRPRQRITTADFDSPLECRVEESGGRFESRDMLARTPLCHLSPGDVSLPPPPLALLEPTPPPVHAQRPAGVYQLQPDAQAEEEDQEREEEKARVAAHLQELTEALTQKRLVEVELKKKKVEMEKVKKENLKFADSLERAEKTRNVEIEKVRKENKMHSDNFQKAKFELEALQKKTKDLEIENKELKEKNNKLRSDLMFSRNSEKSSETTNLELKKKMNEIEKLNEDLKRKIAAMERKSNDDDRRCEEVVPLKKTEKNHPVLVPEKAPAETVPDVAEVKSSPDENDVQESSISSSCLDKLPGEHDLVGEKSSEVEHNLQEKGTKSLSTTPSEPAIASKSVEDSSMESDKRKRLLKEAMRANVEKRQQRMKNALEKTEQIKEDAKARREKFEEGQQKKRASLVPRTSISENPLRVGRRQTSIPVGPSKEPESRPSESVSPTKKIKLADKIPVPKGRSKAVVEGPELLKPTTAVDGGTDVDESPLFYPPPVGRKQKDQEEKVHSPVTSKSELTKTRKRKTEKEESPLAQPSKADQTEMKSPPKKGKKSVKKTKATEKVEVDEADGDNPVEEKEVEKIGAEKPRRGRKPKVKPEEGKETQAETLKKVVEEALTTPDTEVRSRPRRDCKKRFEFLTFSSNPNSPAVSAPANQNPVEKVEVKKQQNKKSTKINKKSIDVPQAPDENLETVEELQPEVVDKPKAAPSKRGRKPGGKKTNPDKDPAEADSVKAIPKEESSSGVVPQEVKPQPPKRGRPKKAK